MNYNYFSNILFSEIFDFLFYYFILVRNFAFFSSSKGTSFLKCILIVINSIFIAFIYDIKKHLLCGVFFSLGTHTLPHVKVYS